MTTAQRTTRPLMRRTVEVVAAAAAVEAARDSSTRCSSRETKSSRRPSSCRLLGSSCSAKAWIAASGDDSPRRIAITRSAAAGARPPRGPGRRRGDDPPPCGGGTGAGRARRRSRPRLVHGMHVALVPREQEGSEGAPFCSRAVCSRWASIRSGVSTVMSRSLASTTGAARRRRSRRRHREGDGHREAGGEPPAERPVPVIAQRSLGLAGAGSALDGPITEPRRRAAGGRPGPNGRADLTSSARASCGTMVWRGTRTWPSTASNVNPRARRVPGEHEPPPPPPGGYPSRAERSYTGTMPPRRLVTPSSSGSGPGSGTTRRSLNSPAMSPSGSAWASPATRMASRSSWPGVGTGEPGRSPRRKRGAGRGRSRTGRRRPGVTRVPPQATRLRPAQAREGVAAEAAAEEEQARGLLAPEQVERPPKLAARPLAVARAPRDETQVQAGHGELRVQVGGELVVLGSAPAASPRPSRQRARR